MPSQQIDSYMLRFVRMIKYGSINPLKKWFILARQRKHLEALTQLYDRVIIFFVPGYDFVSGGIMSIISLAEETEQLHHIHKSSVFVCPAPGEPPLMRFTRFANTRNLVDFKLLLSHIKRGSHVFIHLPEIYVSSFMGHVKEYSSTLSSVNAEFNILLQNVDDMPSKDVVKQLASLGRVSITTAHKAYSNSQIENMYGCKLWHLSVWVSPEQYEYRSYCDKKSIIVVSPDHHPRKDEILLFLRKKLADYEFIIVKNLTYERYKSLIATAKYALTFGEGLDGYFAETIFSGGIGCAVFNERFFTENYRSLPFIYTSWDDLLVNMPIDIQSIDSATTFNSFHKKQYELIASDYSYLQYQKNIERFYQERFDMF